jgi:hypothetical protein
VEGKSTAKSKSTPNESVKIPIRIKKLYNHNGEGDVEGKMLRRGEERNIEKTLKKKSKRDGRREVRRGGKKRRSKPFAGLRSYSDIFIIVIIK